ncbi:hypothetical protein [Micromonospora sp. b486]|uniref:hypothetical protein n=1 Tax=Micromonospora sp. b486 TaxID=3053986 RepID=UPI00259C9EBB|nr:hypothetical protein [Micromonospora sp. b486]MDM4784554.1 hypothetical protein [Micromonospora sp. b486]
MDLLAADTEIRARVTGSGGRALLARLVDAVAPLQQPALAETDFELIAAEVLRRSGSAAWWCCSPPWRRARSATGCCRCCPGWRPGTGWCWPRRRPGAEPAGHRHPGRAGDPYAAASAWRALAERDRYAPPCPRYGVTVVDVPGHRLAPAVADTYLRLKSLGQL